VWSNDGAVIATSDKIRYGNRIYHEFEYKSAGPLGRDASSAARSGQPLAMRWQVGRDPR